MHGSVLVTGATGNVGREVVAHLRARGARARLACRRPELLAGDAGNDEEPAALLDLLDPHTFPDALAGCRALFLLRPPAIANTRATLNVLVDAARDAGLERIVFLSVAGAGDSKLVPHHAVEQHLRKGACDWVILRPGFFAQNLGTAYREDILRDDRIYLPAGRGRAAFVDLRDVGEVAAHCLLPGPEHAGATYTLTGPAAFGFDEVAGFLGEATGRLIRYERASALGYVRHLRRQGMGLGQVVVQTLLHVGLRFGQAEGVDPCLGELLGRRPRDVRQYVQDHAALWLPDPPVAAPSAGPTDRR